MVFEQLPLDGAYRIRLEPRFDNRGFLVRRFCAETFARHGLKTDFVQRTISYNVHRGTVRGLHYQAQPAMETKLVRCIRGAAVDVIVDIRRKSPTFGRWHMEEMAAENHIILYVPEGFAHGFQTLVDATEIDYEITPAYVSGGECGVRYDDPTLNIPWPISHPVISERDATLPPLLI
jgi:dTDP-4-dehydrorhamnose 3,5-epimerase